MTEGLGEGRLPAEGMKAGDRHYRAWVGTPDLYERVAALQFSVLVSLGLREHHRVLDVGCGSLRVGRLLIPFLLPERYFGIEPDRRILDEGIDQELGRDILRVKRPVFSETDDLRLSVFGEEFEYVLAYSILSHASVDQAGRLLEEAARVLAPGGVLVATFVEGDRDDVGTEWRYPGTASYRLDTLVSMAADAGLSLEPAPWPNLEGQRWVLATAPGDPREAGPETYGSLREEVDRLRERLAEAHRETRRAWDAAAESREALGRVARHPAVRAYTGLRRTLRRVLGR